MNNTKEGRMLMGSAIKYKVDPEKAVETILLLSTLKDGIDLYHIAKIIFYAEKEHINRYARPIIGDRYICGKDGPVPSKIRDLVQGKELYLSIDDLQAIHKAIKISKSEDEEFPHISPLRTPDMDIFSESDIECLLEAFKKYGDLSFPELRKLTHDELCYYESSRDKEINYSLLIDKENKDRDDILKEMSETAKYAVL